MGPLVVWDGKVAKRMGCGHTGETECMCRSAPKRVALERLQSCIPVEQSFCAQHKPPAPTHRRKKPIHEHNEENSIDMLHGPLPGKIILFAIPLALSSILQQLSIQPMPLWPGRFYRLDRACRHRRVAGHHAADRPVRRAFHPGANVAIAIHIGHKELDRVAWLRKTTALVTLVSSVALGPRWACLRPEPIPDAIDIPADARAESNRYLQVFCGHRILLGVQLRIGRAAREATMRRPLYALAVAVALNIVLNVVAVTVFDGGVVGIAGDTDVSQRRCGCHYRMDAVARGRGVPA